MAQHKLDIVIVDYLQLMSGPENSGSREQEVSTISRSLKSIAKELNVPILALSQLNRSVEMRGGTKRPLLSDLRESGAIEQDADIVCFIHRPEYYGITQDESGNSLLGVAEIIIAKHRNGATGDIHLSFKKELAKFTDMANLTSEHLESFGKTFSSKMNNDEDYQSAGISSNNKFDHQTQKSGDAPF
jgi:replicative DNA helicase